MLQIHMQQEDYSGFLILKFHPATPNTLPDKQLYLGLRAEALLLL